MQQKTKKSTPEKYGGGVDCVRSRTIITLDVSFNMYIIKYPRGYIGENVYYQTLYFPYVVNF